MKVTQWSCFYLVGHHRGLIFSHRKPSLAEEEEGSPSIPRAAWTPHCFSTCTDHSSKTTPLFSGEKSQEAFCLAFSTLNGEVRGLVVKRIVCWVWKLWSVLLLCFRIAQHLAPWHHAAHVCLAPIIRAFVLKKAQASTPGAATESEEELCCH